MSTSTPTPTTAPMGRTVVHPADYVILAAMLTITMAIGVYHAIKARHKGSTSDYLVGKRQLGVIPVSMSLMVSFMSTVTMLGYPAESYTNGVGYWLSVVGIAIAALVAAVIFVPVFYPLKLTSVNQYFKMRFHSRFVTILGTLGSVTHMICYSGIVFYGSATAIEAITGFPTWASLFIGSALTIIYTSIGGIKAVIWTDVFQTFIIVAGLVAVSIQAVRKVGSFSDVWEVCEKWDRLKFDTSSDPKVRLGVFAVTIGGAFNFMKYYGTSQSSVQRYSSLPSLKKGMLSVFLVVPWTTLLGSLSVLAGLTMFAYYQKEGCDPIKAKYVGNPNQMIPFFVMDTLNYPGIPGLLMASLSSASLSSASSSLNSAAANIWEDVLLEIWPNMSDSRNLLVTKVLVVISGIVAMGIGFVVNQLGGTILQVTVTLVAACSSPTTGMFLLGLAFPFTNWIGASVGGVIGFIFSLWMGFGSYTIKKHIVYLPSTIANCTQYQSAWRDHILDAKQSMQSMTTAIVKTTEATSVIESITGAPEGPGSHPLYDFYAVSFLWLSVYGMTVTLVVGILVSLATGCMRGKKVDPCHFHPLIRRFIKPDTDVDEKNLDEYNKDSITNGNTKLPLDNPAFTNGYSVTPSGNDHIMHATKC